MRRTIFALSIVLSSIGLIGCEDGPNQTFEPTPPGAGDLINASGADGAVDPAQQGYNVDAGGTTKIDICTAPQKQQIQAAMVKKPIIPPLGGAGIDMSGKDWAGLVVEDAENPALGGNCQSDNYYTSGDGTSYNSWGDPSNPPVLFQYYVSTHKLFRMLFVGGYVGTLDFTSRDGAHKYSMGTTSSATGGYIELDGAHLLLDWTTPDQGSTFPKLAAVFEPLVDALFATFLPGLPAVPHCLDNGLCQVASFTDGEGYLFVPALGFGWRVNPYYAPQPTPSIAYFLEVELEKVLPFASAPPFLKLDAEGPIAKQSGLGKNGTTCELRMTSVAGALTYGDFLKNCVQVNGGADDTTELNKLIGGIRRGTESFSFDVSGVDINFTDKTLPPDKVVADTDFPTPDDEAATFDVDQNTLGAFANDYANNDTSTTKDLHGTGYVYFEFARLLQEYLQQFRPANTPERKLGDPACLAPNLILKNDGTVDPLHPVPPGCTGLEGFMTTVPASAVANVANQPFAANIALDPAIALQTALRIGLKPGHPTAYYCTKKASSFTSSDRPDTDSASCSSALIFGGSYQRVLNVFGNGKATNLPLDVQDRRFFFKQYAIALFKYLKIANTATASLTADMVHNVTLDPNNVFFDSIGSGQFETAEYVERQFATNGELPTDVTITADVIDGIFNDYSFARYLYRGERSLYQAIQCTDPDPTHCAPGDHPLQGLGAAENRALLTNIFGSPLLKAEYTDVSATQDAGADAAPTTVLTHTAYDCATADPPDPKDLSGTGDTSTCKNQLPPMAPSTTVGCDTNVDCNAVVGAPLCLGAHVGDPKSGRCTDIMRDDAGRPFLAGYPGTIGPRNTVFSLGTSPLKITAKDFTIESVMFNVKFHVDPYDLSSNYTDNKGTNVLIPWLLKQPGVGFPVPISGTIDHFITTYQADFSGNTITANIDYDVDDETLPIEKQTLKFMAVETSDFLGEVFLCKDAKTGDFLTARMYSSVALILDWFAAHPAAYGDCDIITRYSPYNNYPDYITSLVNGVRLGVTQGGGYGRIVDVTLYDPNSLPQFEQ